MYYTADAAAWALGRWFVLTHQGAALFYVKWRHDGHLESVTPNRKYNSNQIPIIQLPQTMSIYWKNNPAKFYRDLIWNDGVTVGVKLKLSRYQNFLMVWRIMP